MKEASKRVRFSVGSVGSSCAAQIDLLATFFFLDAKEEHRGIAASCLYEILRSSAMEGGVRESSRTLACSLFRLEVERTQDLT